MVECSGDGLESNHTTMIKVFQLIFAPHTTWEKIQAAERGYGWVLFLFLAPLLALTAVVEGLAMVKLGRTMGEFGHKLMLPVSQVYAYELIQIGMLIVVLLALAQFIKGTSDGFLQPPPYLACFKVAAYSLGPFLLLRLLAMIPIMNVWLAWGIAAVISSSTLYVGIPVLLRPEPTKAFGQFIINALSMIVLTLLCQLFTVFLLYKKFLV